MLEGSILEPAGGRELEETPQEHAWGGGMPGMPFGRMLRWEEVS